MAVTIIREIRNNAGGRVTMRNMEDPADTADARGLLQSGEVRMLNDVELAIPWCGDWEQADFARRHIRIEVAGGATFFVWQASHNGLDRVRVSTDGRWHKPGDVIGGFAAVGWIEEWFGGKERTLVINDFTLWLLPIGLSETIKCMSAELKEKGLRLCGAPLDRPIPSVPKMAATAFSMAGNASDTLDAGRPGARFLYRDSGKRYGFELKDGTVQFQPPVHGRTSIGTRVSFRSRRVGEAGTAPSFDLIAANGGRVFAKEKGWDRFYFALVDEGYVHAGKDGREFAVHSSCLVLDPEFNQPGASLQHLTQPLRSEFHDFEGHPATERWPALRLLLSFGLLDVMLVRIPRFTWMLVDTRPPMGGQSDELFRKLKESTKQPDVAIALMALAGLTGVAKLPLPGAPKAEPAGAPPPIWAPSYNHTSYCVNAAIRFWRKSIDYKRVLDIGVGHVHHHEQYEGVTGGEIQPFFVGWDNPNWLFNAAAHYRFMFGPVRDGDGFIDGTCNYYLLVQLKDDAQIRQAEADMLVRRSAYGALWIDEQSFFTQRWHLLHPDDHFGALISMVERLHTDPARYGWRPELFWCPFRTGYIGPRSRMAVAAQVVLVTAEDPSSKEALLCSINFSFGTIDRSWHFRKLPVPARYFDGASLWTPPVTTVTGEEQVLEGPDACVYPQTARLREDMTICLRGRGPGRDGRTEVGYWYQRYLPSTNETMPPGAQLQPGQQPDDCTRLRTQTNSLVEKRRTLTESMGGLDPRDPGDRLEIARIRSEIAEIERQIAVLQQQSALIGCSPYTPGARPTSGYTHAWKFLPESVFKAADRFSHFGVYAAVDSRMQYCLATPKSPADEAALKAGESGGWIDDRDQLAIDAYPFRFDWMRLPWPISVPPPLEPKPRPSLFNPDIRLRVAQRGSQWIATYWDKRDDDLMPFAGLPKTVTLKFREGPELKDGAGRVNDATLVIEANQWVKLPPAVRLGYFGWEAPTSQARAVIGFLPSRPQVGLDNVWRVRMAALDPSSGQPIPLLDAVVYGTFTQTPAGAYDYRWTANPTEQAKLKRYCSPAGAVIYGTSIWFEDVVGHVSVPEEVQWRTAPT